MDRETERQIETQWSSRKTQTKTRKKKTSLFIQRKR